MALRIECLSFGRLNDHLRNENNIHKEMNFVFVEEISY